jgi:glycerol-3-phosphate O-acyltransferase/dihydroxyacetone phosphate acyltransferase
MLRGVLVTLFRRVVRLYFRRIERVGESPPAETAGRLFVSNHHNALVDPILVLTDTDCIISPVAKSTLWSIPGLRWLLDVAEAVPILRRKDFAEKDVKANDATFDRIAGHLARGGNILIFPEGKSHSEPKVAKLRTGAARMLMLADGQLQDGRANDAPSAPLTFQAVALEFDARDKFRSRCLVLWGPVRKLADVPGEGEERVRGVTDLMAGDLSELLVEGETHEERLLIARVAEMLANDAGHETLERWNDFGRQVELASKALAVLAKTQGSVLKADVEAAVTTYYEELAKLGLRDWQLSRGRAPTANKPWSRWIRRAATVPFAVPGLMLFSVPYFATRLVSRITTNRPEAGDVISTAKLATGFLAHPVWAAALIALAFVYLPTWIAACITAGILVAPFAALAWLDAWEARVPGVTKVATPERIERLMTLRAEALAAIRKARERLASASP